MAAAIASGALSWPPMGFMGGSAYAMARDITEGFILVTERTFKTMQRSEVDQLAFEMDRYLREIRGDQPALDDMAAIQQRNRRISRINQAMIMVRAYQQKRR
jgi:hypothetical protein